jgi:glutathione peroxidase
MVAMEREYRDRGLSIMCFPSDEFGGQELKKNADIDAFVKKFGEDHGLLMMDKIATNGANTASVWQWLKDTSGDTSDVGWNFRTKFLVSPDGKSVKRYERKDPSDIEADIVALLEGGATKSGL